MQMLTAVGASHLRQREHNLLHVISYGVQYNMSCQIILPSGVAVIAASCTLIAKKSLVLAEEHNAL